MPICIFSYLFIYYKQNYSKRLVVWAAIYIRDVSTLLSKPYFSVKHVVETILIVLIKGKTPKIAGEFYKIPELVVNFKILKTSQTRFGKQINGYLILHKKII